jgi:hypothetical protein
MPSKRSLGTLQRVNAILQFPTIYELGGQLEVAHEIGRPAVHPPYVLLAFAALGRMSRSTVRVETDLMDPSNWQFVRDQMIRTIRQHGIDVPLPAKTPPAWHHWRRFRDDHLSTDEGLAALKRGFMPLAVGQARSIGLIDPTTPGSWTHPSRERALYGDGTIVRPIYAPPAAVRIQGEAGEQVLYPDRHTGDLSTIAPHRFDPDIAEHHGHGGPVHGHGYVAFHVRHQHPYGRVTLGIERIPAPGAEADTALRLLADLRRECGDGPQVVVYDGALHGVHIDQIMRRWGYLVISKLPDYAEEGGLETTAMIKGAGGRRVASHALGVVNFGEGRAACRHALAAVDGRVVEIDLDESGDPVVVSDVARGPIKRSRRKDGRYHFNFGYHVSCGSESHTVWLSPHAERDGDPRPGVLRAIPDGDEDSLRIKGIRSDSESSHSQFKRTLITNRAMSLGWRRGLIDYYNFALYSNAMTHARSEDRASITSQIGQGRRG